MAGKVRGFKKFNTYTDEEELPLLCGITEMCRFFQCSDQTARRKCREGRIPGAFQDGKSWYCHKSDLLNYGKGAE